MRQLLVRGVSLHLLFDPVWLMAPTQHAVYLHIVTELLERVARGELTPHVAPAQFPLDKIRQAFRHMLTARPATVIVHP
jgi:hypothetical protein